MSKFDGRGSIPYAKELDKYTPKYDTNHNFSTLINPAKMQTKKVASGVGLNKTIETIKLVTSQTVHQTVDLAAFLKASTHEQSAYHVWHFLKTNIRYQLDPKGTELIRTPARSWADRQSGIDCEDYAIFAATLLENMGLPSVFSVVAFNNNTRYGHIFTESNNFVLDAVWRLFNEYPPRITKKMMLQWK